LAIALAVLPSSVQPATAVIGAAKDNSIFQNNPSNSGGGSAGIHVGTNGMGSPRRGLIEFDIAGNVPAGSVVTGVELTLFVGNAPLASFHDISLHRLTRDWGEGAAGDTNPAIGGSGQGYPAGPQDATWTHAMFGTVAWTNDGAQGDFNTVASATTSVGGPIDSPHTWTTTAAMVSDVQGWLDIPASNFGWALVNADEATIRSSKSFYSREATQNSSGDPNSLDPSWRPRLTIAYSSTAPPTGDYNRNGVVDAADYVFWRKMIGQPAIPSGSGADGSENGEVDDDDYGHWTLRFGTPTTGRGDAFAVAEPLAVLSLLFAGPLAFSRRQR